MMLNLSTFSQTSLSNTSIVNKYPKSLIINKDTVIAFKIEQARELAIKVETVNYQDTIIKNLQQTDNLKNSIISEQDVQINTLKDKIKNDIKIDSMRVIQLSNCDGIVKNLEKEVKKERIKRKIAIVGGTTAVILTILAFLLL